MKEHEGRVERRNPKHQDRRGRNESPGLNDHRAEERWFVHIRRV